MLSGFVLVVVFVVVDPTPPTCCQQSPAPEIMWQPAVSPPRWQGKAPLCRDSSRGPGLKGRLVGICTQISGTRCDRASGRVGKVVRDVVDLQWKRDMRQGVVTCLCEVGLGCGAFPWIGGAQQEKQMVFGLEGLC